MSVYRYVRLDVFSNQPFTGIPLAMFPDAAGIDERRMQRIANEMALPETTFVFPPEAPETDARVRIFTPTRELPMAGSPTIGTVFALAGAGRLRASADKTVLGLGIGRTTVGLEWGQNAWRFAWMTQPIPTFGPIVTDSVAVAAAVGVQPCDLADGNLPVQVASSGVLFLYVPLRSRAAVDAASIERGRLCALLRPWISKSSLYLYSRASRRTMMLPCTVECSGPASEFRRIRPQAPRVGRWARISSSTTQCQSTMPRGS
jgi:trans-2,3-dihydro-3-hydroxyanthranilate isomerase